MMRLLVASAYWLLASAIWPLAGADTTPAVYYRFENASDPTFDASGLCPLQVDPDATVVPAAHDPIARTRRQRMANGKPLAIEPGELLRAARTARRAFTGLHLP